MNVLPLVFFLGIYYVSPLEAWDWTSIKCAMPWTSCPEGNDEHSQVTTIASTTLTDQTTVETYKIPQTTVKIKKIPQITGKPNRTSPTSIKPNTIPPTSVKLVPPTSVKLNIISPTTVKHNNTISPITVNPNTFSPTIINPNDTIPSTTVNPNTVYPTIINPNNTIPSTTVKHNNTISPITINPNIFSPTIINPNDTIPSTTVKHNNTISPITVNPNTVFPTIINLNNTIPLTTLNPKKTIAEIAPTTINTSNIISSITVKPHTPHSTIESTDVVFDESDFFAVKTTPSDSKDVKNDEIFKELIFSNAVTISAISEDHKQNNFPTFLTTSSSLDDKNLNDVLVSFTIVTTSPMFEDLNKKDSFTVVTTSTIHSGPPIMNQSSTLVTPTISQDNNNSEVLNVMISNSSRFVDPKRDEVFNKTTTTFTEHPKSYDPFKEISSSKSETTQDPDNTDSPTVLSTLSYKEDSKKEESLFKTVVIFLMIVCVVLVIIIGGCVYKQINSDKKVIYIENWISADIPSMSNACQRFHSVMDTSLSYPIPLNVRNTNERILSLESSILDYTAFDAENCDETVISFFNLTPSVAVRSKKSVYSISISMESQSSLLNYTASVESPDEIINSVDTSIFNWTPYNAADPVTTLTTRNSIQRLHS